MEITRSGIKIQFDPNTETVKADGSVVPRPTRVRVDGQNTKLRKSNKAQAIEINRLNRQVKFLAKKLKLKLPD